MSSEARLAVAASCYRAAPIKSTVAPRCTANAAAVLQPVQQRLKILRVRRKRQQATSPESYPSPLYFFNAPLHGPRTRRPRSSRAQTPAPAHCSPHRHPHFNCRRNPQRRRTRLPPGLQHAANFLLQPAPVGAVRTKPSALRRNAFPPRQI